MSRTNSTTKQKSIELPNTIYPPSQPCKRVITAARSAHDRCLSDAAKVGDTFEAIAREWMEHKRGKWTPYYAEQVERYLQLNVFPDIGSLSIEKVTTAHLFDLLRCVKRRGAP